MSQYLLIEDFKGGLDSRRGRFTAKAGTLYNLVNAHISRGGEIEKRKAFVPYAQLPKGKTFGLQAANSILYTFGSEGAPLVPAGVNYQQLVSPSGAAMTALLAAENFNGAIYTVAKFADGSIYHFYGGVRVTTWDSIVTTVADNDGVAAGFALSISSDENFTATSLGPVVTITERNPNIPFTILTTVAAGGAGVPSISSALIQAGHGEIFETLATGSFAVTGGTSSPGVNHVTSVTVNGVEVLGASVDWASSNATTATLLATQINAFAASTTPQYTASASGSVVTIKAVAGSGSTPNGYVVATTNGGTVTTGNFNPFAGGVSAANAAPQISTITIGGTFDIGNTYTATLTISVIHYAATYFISGESAGIGTIVKTFGSKMYAEASSLLYFSQINDPTQWAITQTNGSGFINMSNQDSGSEVLTGMGEYQGKMAIFSRRAIQMWSLDADPTKNAKIQTLTNIGTYAPRSVISYGDLNLFFLSDIGIRSLIPRDASGNATVSDVGTNVDTILQANIVGLTPAQLANSVGIIEPTDGRYWLAIGPLIYVYSYFAAASISAWSLYDPGFNIDFMVYSSGSIYVRAGDNIYVYGGTNGTTYDASPVTVEFPFLDGGKPGNIKTLRKIDAAVDGTWNIFCGGDPRNPEAKDLIGTIDGITYNELSLEAAGMSTHFGVKMTSTFNGYCRIGNFAFHFDDDGTT